MVAWCHCILATTRAISYLPFIPLTPSAGALGKFFNLLYFYYASPREIMFPFLFPTRNKYNGFNLGNKIVTQRDCWWLPDQCWEYWPSGILVLLGVFLFVCCVTPFCLRQINKRDSPSFLSNLLPHFCPLISHQCFCSLTLSFSNLSEVVKGWKSPISLNLSHTDALLTVLGTTLG